MPARVMISSVTKDECPQGDLDRLSTIWHEASGLQQRLCGGRVGEAVTFSAMRTEIAAHLLGKYGFDAYIFEKTPGAGRSPEEETVREAYRADLVVAIFGSKTGWTVGDQDPLTPTLREWRAGLQQILKFRLFWMKGSVRPEQIPGELGSVLKELTDYKTGTGYLEFSSAADLFVKLDGVVQEYVNSAVFHYAKHIAAKVPSSDTELWLLASYRKRVELMQKALGRVADRLGVHGNILRLGEHRQPVSLHCVPDGFAVAEARKFVAYVFDDESEGRKRKSLGRLPIVACFRGISDGQIRKHLGNIEATEVYSSQWGFYAADPISGRQAIYLPHCANPLGMESLFSNAVTWLGTRQAKIKQLSVLRQQILDAGG